MKIEVKGPIISDSEQWIYDWFDLPATSANKINKMLNQAQPGEEIELLINSGGGSIFAGSEIYTALKSYNGKIIGKITGIAGSAASVIAMGCSELQISPTAQMMIHNSQGTFEGDYNDMQLGADILKSINDSIANAYQIKTGKPHAELLSMMNNETWMNAQKAKELGFVDSIMFTDEINVTNAVTTDQFGMLPKAVINKMRNECKPKNVEPEQIKNIALDIAKAKLNLISII